MLHLAKEHVILNLRHLVRYWASNQVLGTGGEGGTRFVLARTTEEQYLALQNT